MTTSLLNSILLTLFVFVAPTAPVRQVAGTVSAADFPGVDWVAKMNAAAATLTGGGTVDMPDSISGNATTIGMIASNITLEFTGSATFRLCQLNVGKFTKIYNHDALLLLRGTNCTGINQVNFAVLQTTDKFTLDGVRLDCDQQPNSTGILVGAGHAQTTMRNITVTNCSNSGLRLEGAQFGEYSNVSLYHNQVGLKIYTTVAGGGGNSNTFYGLKAVGNSVGVLIADSAKFGMGPDYFIDPSMLSNSVAAMAVSGNTWPADIHWFGGAPEANGGGPSAITIDGHLIKQASIYANHARITLTEVTIEEAAVNPFIRGENDSTIVLNNISGYGRWDGILVSVDATSTTTLEGRLDALGSIENVVAYPSAIRSSGYVRIYGVPLRPNFSNNASTLSIVDSRGSVSSGAGNDAVMGRVVTVHHMTAVGTQETNRVNFGNVGSPAGSLLVSILVKSSLDCSYILAAHGDGYSAIRVPLLAGRWTRIVIFKPESSKEKEFILMGWPDDATGPTVSFANLETTTGTSNSGQAN